MALQLKQLSNLKSKYLAECHQHPVIPTRIYSTLILGINKELDDFESVSDNILTLVKLISSDPLIGRSINSQRRKAEELGVNWNIKDASPAFSDLTCTYNLEKYLSSFGTKVGIPIKSATNLSGLLTRILSTCKQAIHLYSGMRAAETANLPFHCHEIFRTNGKDHHLIVGKTTKLNHGKPKRAKWITSVEGVRAIVIAQKISMAIYETIGDIPKKTALLSDNYPLFVSIGHLNLSPNRLKQVDIPYRIGTFSLLFISSMPHLIPTMEDSDIRELEEIDPHRAWRAEKNFQIGNPWLLTSHQFRRSLAVYASSSGYVTLPSLFGVACSI